MLKHRDPTDQSRLVIVIQSILLEILVSPCTEAGMSAVALKPIG